jgi:hypothetical protein
MPVASDIQIWIKQKYPDATIIEMDNEKGKLEVDILDGGKAKELIFQGNDWLSTSWEVSKAEVPSVVMETFRHSNFGKFIFMRRRTIRITISIWNKEILKYICLSILPEISYSDPIYRDDEG